jgi:hypothetical protein
MMSDVAQHRAVGLLGRQDDPMRRDAYANGGPS